MPDIITKIRQNALEPTSLIEAFLHNPPENFVVQNTKASSSQEIYGFFADLDLTTTLDDNIKKKIDSLRRFSLIDFIIKKLITTNVLFVGTPVSEYLLLPETIDFADFKDGIFSIFKKSARQFLIVKDIPASSPLLSDNENKLSADFTDFLRENGFVILTGQALAYLPINFNSIDGYLAKFSHNRRKKFRQKMKIGTTLKLQEVSTGDAFFSDETVEYLYNLYLNTYNKSDIHFDKLTLQFFQQVLQNSTDGKVFIYRKNDKIISFNLCYIIGNYLVDKYAGSLYPDALDAALFFNNTFDNINYCLQHNLKTYIMGWTSAQAKAYVGCDFTYTNHAIYMKNPIIRTILLRFKSYFEPPLLSHSNTFCPTTA
jgi:hypothetical protein